MYLAMLAVEEQEQIVRALRGWQFDRSAHGSLYDRGSADSWYGRAMDPHYGGVGGGSGATVSVTDAASVAEYQAGYDHSEHLGGHKEW